MLKKILLVVAVAILALVFIARNNSNPKSILAGLSNDYGLSPNELIYKIYFLGCIPVGEAIIYTAKLESYNGNQVYHLVGQAKNAKLFTRFCKVSANLDSYIDKMTGNPLVFKQSLSISGKKESSKLVTYDQVNNTMAIAGVERSTYPNTQDPLSVIYNLMHMDLDKMESLEFSLNTNQKNYYISGDVKKQTIYLGKKEYNLAIVNSEIKRRDKNPYHKSNVAITLSQGRENIPILIKVFASGLLINVKLVDIK